MALAVLDTNVIISGLFFKGNERKVLVKLFERKFTNMMPEHVLREIRRVIARKFSSHPLSLLVPTRIYQEDVGHASKMIADQKDAFILACALSLKPDFLVTGDKDFHEVEKPPSRMITSKEFLAVLESPVRTPSTNST